MNRFIIAISLIAFTLVFSIISLFYINNTFDTMTQHLDTSIESAINNEQAQTQKNLEKTLKEWEKRDDFLNIILGQGETNEVKNYLISALNFTLMGDTRTAVEHINWAKVEIERIKNANSPSISTIL